MPKRPISHELEDLSRGRLRRAFESIGWTVEDLSKDYGEDMLVRIFEDGETTPYSFFVQAKATQDIRKYSRKKSSGLTFPVESGHVRHWVRFSEPVFLTVWDSVVDLTYWVCVQDALQNQTTSDPASIKKPVVQVRIPTANILDAVGLKRVHGITKLRFARLERSDDIAEILKAALLKFGISLEYDDEVVFLLDRRGAEVIISGYLASLVDDLSRSTGRTHEETLKSSIDELYVKAVLRSEFSHEEFLTKLNEASIAREIWKSEN